MTKHRRPTRALPSLLAQLTLTSWETILRRSAMMAQGTCSPAEYWRMGAEKIAAVQASAAAVMTGRGQRAALAPFLKRTRANARRLRRKP